MKKMKILLAFSLFFSMSASADEETVMLSLDQAIDIAVENNPSIKASEAEVDIMKARLRNTKSVLYPQVEFRFIVPFVERESGLFVDQLIWDFWRTPNLVKAGKAQVESSMFDKAATEEDVILNTRISYFTVLARQHILHAAERKLNEEEMHFRQARGFFKSGRASRLEVTRAEVQEGNARVNLISARHNLELAKMSLLNAMGIREREFKYELEDMLDYHVVDLNLENAINRALDTRPELKGLEAKEAGMRATLSASQQALYFPEILGRVAYRFEGEGATGPDFIAGIGLRFPIFQGFSDLAKVNEDTAKLRQSMATIESLKSSIASEIKELYFNLKTAEETLRVTEISKRSAEETLELAREEYRLGKSSAVDVAEAESLFATTNANHVEAIYNYKIALARIERATGERIER